MLRKKRKEKKEEEKAKTCRIFIAINFGTGELIHVVLGKGTITKDNITISCIHIYNIVVILRL